MILVRVVIDGNDCLRMIEAGGHASDGVGLFGSNVVCAAASSVLRAFVGAVSEQKGISARGRAESPGELGVLIDGVVDDQIAWLQGASRVLLEGLTRLAGESPDEISVEVRELENGT